MCSLFRTKATLQKDIEENEDLVRRRNIEVQVSMKNISNLLKLKAFSCGKLSVFQPRT